MATKMLMRSVCTIAVLLDTSIHAIVVVDRRRDGQDVFSHNGGNNVTFDCSKQKAHVQTARTCRCDWPVRTFGSNDPPCTSFPECNAVASKIPGVILITRNNSNHKLAPSVGGNKCKIKGINIWNIPSYRNNTGVWIDVTAFASKYVNLSRHNGRRELVIKIPFESWQGQLIKINLKCHSVRGNCAVFKVEGLVTYPFVTSKLNPDVRPFPPTCCSDDEEESNNGGYIIAIVVVLVILIAIGIVLIRVCRHKLPWRKTEDGTDNDYESEKPSCSRPTGPEYEELLSTSNVNDTIPEDINNENPQYEETRCTGASSYEDASYAVPSSTGPDNGEVYYSVINTLNPKYDEAVPPTTVTSISNPVYNDGTPNVINLTDGIVNNSTDSPQYHELEKNDDSIVNNSTDSPHYHELEENNAVNVNSSDVT